MLGLKPDLGFDFGFENCLELGHVITEKGLGGRVRGKGRGEVFVRFGGGQVAAEKWEILRGLVAGEQRRICWLEKVRILRYGSFSN